MSADMSADRSAVHDMIERLPDLVNRDAALLRRGRYLDLDVMIEIGDVPYYASIAGGRIARLDRGPLLMRSWALAFRGRDEAWRLALEQLDREMRHRADAGRADGERAGMRLGIGDEVGDRAHRARERNGLHAYSQLTGPRKSRLPSGTPR